MTAKLTGGPAVVQARLAYDPVEAGELLSVSRTMIYELMASGRLPYVKVGRVRRIRHEAVVAYLDGLAEQLVALLLRIGSRAGEHVVTDRRELLSDVGPGRVCRGTAAEQRWADWFLAAIGAERGARSMYRSPAPGRTGNHVDLATHGPVLPKAARRAQRRQPAPDYRWRTRLLVRALACAERIQARRERGHDATRWSPGGR